MTESWSPDPVLVFEHRKVYELEGPVPSDPDFVIELGTADLVRAGSDVTVVAWGWMRHEYPAPTLQDYGSIWPRGTDGVIQESTIQDLLQELIETDAIPAADHPLYIVHMPAGTRVVKSDGSVSDVIITGAEPVGLFEQAAVDAVRKWRYKPVQRDGHAVDQRARLRMKFALDK